MKMKVYEVEKGEALVEGVAQQAEELRRSPQLQYLHFVTQPSIVQ